MGEIHFTPKDILQKDFKQKIRGYDPTDVDSFLDMVIRDYESFGKSLKQLRDENNQLRNKIDELSERLASQDTSTSLSSVSVNNEATSQRSNSNQRPDINNATYMDILKRLSNLENHVFGSHMGDNDSHRL